MLFPGASDAATSGAGPGGGPAISESENGATSGNGAAHGDGLTATVTAHTAPSAPPPRPADPPPVQPPASGGASSLRAVITKPQTLGALLILFAALLAVASGFALSQLQDNAGNFSRIQEVSGWTWSDWGWIALAVALAALAVGLLLAGIKLLLTGGSGVEGSFHTTLIGSALLDIGVGATVTIVISLISQARSQNSWWNEIAVALGLIAAVLTALAYSEVHRQRSWPSRLNPWQYGQLSERWDNLNARIGDVCPAGVASPSPMPRGCPEATAHRDYIARALGFSKNAWRDEEPQAPEVTGSEALAAPRTSLMALGTADKWMLGTGFVELWERLHAAEAALIPLQSRQEIIASGLFDELRVRGSGMTSEVVLLSRLRLAIATLGGTAFLSEGAEELGATDGAGDGAAGDTQAREDAAVQVLVGVRRTIDQLRDQSRAGLARTRIHLIWTGIVTAVVAYALLALAIMAGAGLEQIVAGVTFFLVAAVTGLIWQLRSSSSKIRSGEDDFGLDAARMVYTPILSGLAGVGGVLLMAMLYPTLNVVLDPAISGGTNVTVPSLDTIFSLTANRFGIVVAAIFGLTPDLLINRLQGEADRYKVDLQNTSVQTRIELEPIRS